MKKSDALKRYCECREINDYVVDKIANWDEQETIKYNSIKLNMSPSSCRNLTIKYKLKYKEVGSGRKRL